jgi:uncharacterized protein (TIGR03067 family)
MKGYLLGISMLVIAAVTDVRAVPDRPQKKDNLKKEEMKKLQGPWVLISLTEDGRQLGIADFKLTFAGNKYTVTVAGRISLEGTFRIDPTKKPKVFEETHTSGAKRGQSSVGIYKLEGDRLTICLPETGKDNRPTGFVSKAGTGHELTVFKREKK